MAATFSDPTNGVYTLPAQTTPFLPTATSATCNNRSILCFTPSASLPNSFACDLIDAINPTAYTYLNPDCYPPHYDKLGQNREAAYPGDACPTGWSAACTTTLTVSSKVQTQTWCCPGESGTDEWMCTDRDLGFGDPTSRLCVMTIGGATGVWFSQGEEEFVTSTVGGDMGIRAIRIALALEGADSVTSTAASTGGTARTTGARVVGTGTGSGGVSETGTSEAGLSDGSNGGTNPGIIAGIVVGCLALLGFIGLGIFMCVRYKREGKEEKSRMEEGKEEAHEEAHEEVAEAPGNVEVDGKDVVVKEVTVTELPARWSKQGFAEMGSDTAAVELPTEYNSGGKGRD